MAYVNTQDTRESIETRFGNPQVTVDELIAEADHVAQLAINAYSPTKTKAWACDARDLLLAACDPV